MLPLSKGARRRERARCDEHLHARQVISGNQHTWKEKSERAVMSPCMQGRSSVAINIPLLQPGVGIRVPGRLGVWGLS